MEILIVPSRKRFDDFRDFCRWIPVFVPRNRNQCQDINECLNHNGGCNGGCVNTAGSYYCTCNGDLVLASDERTCISAESRCRAMEPPLHAEVRNNLLYEIYAKICHVLIFFTNIHESRLSTLKILNMKKKARNRIS